MGRTPENLVSHGAADPVDIRLDSWKSIAAFLGRDRRTVQRWEKSRNLPVYRIPGENGTVFAFRPELERWLKSALPENEIAEDSAEGVAENVEESGSPAENSLRPTRWWPVALTLLGALAIGSATWGWGIVKARRASPKSLEAVHHVPTAKAKELYLEGAFAWNSRTTEGLRKALGSFSAAATEDPLYADAYVGQAQAYELMPEYGTLPAREAFPLAIAAAERAIAVDPASADAHRVLAFGLFYWKWDLVQAQAEFRRAIDLNPSSAEAHHWYANALFLLHQDRESEAEIQRARELDPNSRAILSDSLLIQWAQPGRAEESLAKLRELQATEHDFVSPARYLSALYVLSGDYAHYVSQLATLATLSHSSEDQEMAQTAERGWKAGGKDGVNRALRELQEKRFRDGRTSGFELALTCIRLGDNTAAVPYLRAAVQSRDFFSLTLLHTHELAVATALKQPEFRPVLNTLSAQVHAADGKTS